MTEFIYTEADDSTPIETFVGLSRLLQLYPKIGWLKDPTLLTDQNFIKQGAHVRVVTDSPRPAAAEYQNAVPSYEKQQDGTWLKIWTLQDKMTVAEAKQLLAERANKLYWSKILLTDELPTPAETLAANGDPSLVDIAGRVAFWFPKLQTFAGNVTGASTLAQCFTLYEQLKNAA